MGGECHDLSAQVAEGSLGLLLCGDGLVELTTNVLDPLAGRLHTLSQLIERHTLGFDIHRQICDSVLIGFGGYLVNDRLDVDADTFATIEGENYFVARVYGRIAITEDVDLNLRVENAFDEDYDEVHGFPALGLAAYGGITIEF